MGRNKIVAEVFSVVVTLPPYFCQVWLLAEVVEVAPPLLRVQLQDFLESEWLDAGLDRHRIAEAFARCVVECNEPVDQPGRN